MLTSTKRSLLRVARLLYKTKILSIEQSKKVKIFQISAGFEPARFWTFSECSTTRALELEGIHRLIPINVTASVYEALTTVFSAF